MLCEESWGWPTDVIDSLKAKIEAKSKVNYPFLLNFMSCNKIECSLPIFEMPTCCHAFCILSRVQHKVEYFQRVVNAFFFLGRKL